MVTPIFGEEGQKVGYMTIREDITDKKKVEELAVTDPLTGLFNRLKLDEVLNYELNQVRRYGGELSVIIVDIDNFKSVNDTYGHQIGDEVLKHLAKILMVNVRASDIPGRWGGRGVSYYMS